ncbi:P-loop NTPase [Polyangium jinanense]|uniref:SIR2 family protein n=1 Tax=Polyangium jinanense TaxID=2829994 RepID=A0A9X3XHQ1_9BACT|nr:SIR2 family protein [Polyangium jinanense]MDC3962623.1 SIR2 family protein [Polyangium jinanense]MDC3988361.1 SIR2 family protein [Polyangium jinanense]
MTVSNLMAALTDDQLSLFRNAVRNGHYRLLLGAGFSRSSIGPDGKNLPLGGELARELAAAFDLPADYPLASLSDAIPPDALSKFLVAKFLGCKASTTVRTLPSFIWRRIYTYNIDNVLLDAYHDNDRALQKIQCVTHSDPFQDRDEPGSVQVVYLHGYVERPEAGFVFSTRSYAGHVDEHNVWDYIFADEIQEKPFIVMGCALNEFDLEVFLKRRDKSHKIRSRSAPSLFVTPHVDSIVERVCERHGLTIVKATADEFISQLNEVVPDRPTVIDLLRPKTTAALFGSASAERIFFSQWRHVGDAVSQSAGQAPPHILTGCEPNWDHVRRNEILPRTDTANLAAGVLRWASNPARSIIRIVFAPAGSGKSCLLLDVATTLANQKVATFFWDGDARMSVDEAVTILKGANEPVVLMVDRVGDHIDQLVDLIYKLEGSKARVLILGVDRGVRQQFIDGLTKDSFYESSSMATLTLDEALSFVAALRKQGLLGARAGYSDGVLGREITGGDLLSGLVQLSMNVSLASRMNDELLQLSDRGRRIYSVVCLAHTHAHSAREGIVRAAAKCSAKELYDALDGELRALVLPKPDGTLLTRHRVVAEQTYGLLGRRSYDVHVALARALRPYVSREAIKQRQPEARLAGRLLDAEFVEGMLQERAAEFYEEIAPDWQWNSRYWEQRALFTVPTDPDKALRYAEQAVGIENHPLPLTTLAKIQFTVAEMRGYARFEDRRLVLDALESAKEAVVIAKRRHRHEVHPHDVAVRGAITFLKYAKAHSISLSEWPGWATMDFIAMDLRRVHPRGSAEQLRKDWERALNIYRSA